MLQFLVRLILGYCRFDVQTADPIRLYNRLHGQKIYFWKPAVTQYRASFYCTKQSAPMVYRTLTGLGITEIKVKGRGLPFILSTVRRKVIFAVLLFLAVMIPLISGYYIEDITVSGNSSVASESILLTLEQVGIKKYAYIPGLELKNARQQLLLSQPKLSWATLNLDKNRLEVIVHEKTQNQTILPDDPCNIVAACDGIICKIDVLSGKQLVFGKTAVRKGQLLVSGFLETETGKLSYLHSQATVIAEIELTKSYTVDLTAEDYVLSGKQLNRYRLEIFGMRLPLYRADSLPKQPYTVASQRRGLEVFGVSLPFYIDKNTYTLYHTTGSTLTKTDALEILRQQFEEYEIYELEDAAIIERTFETKESKNKIIMTGTYRIQRDIGRSVKIGVIE